MSQSPYVPSTLTTPPLQTRVADPSIVHSTSVEEYPLAYYPSAAYQPPIDYASSPAGPRKVPTMTYPPIGSPFDGLASAPTIAAKPKTDMNFAKKDSTAAKPGIQTPLANYTGKSFARDQDEADLQRKCPPQGAAGITNPFDYPRHPSTSINPLQVTPSPDFIRFVAQLLQITMVSHSVTLVALLYIYRLKKRYNIDAGAGTEMRPFIAALILSNKYLDDNTYTNKTWADLTGLPVSEISKMETEFLRGLEYRLCVEKSDYEIWHHLLDGFILSRSNPGAYRSRYNPDYTYSPPSNPLVTPVSAYVPQTHYVPSPAEIRARSVSPVAYSPDGQPQYVTPGYGYGRKRSAVDAFAGDPMYHPPNYVPSYRPPSKHPKSAVPQSANSGLARSTSLTRQIARMPGSSGSIQGNRRGSAGCANALGWTAMHGDDLRHVAAHHAALLSHDHAAEYQGHEAMQGGWDSLVAPCNQLPEAHAIPPEQLMFYTISAQAHPGQDGAPRKAILRHQQPHPYSYPPHAQQYSMSQRGPTLLGQEWLGADPMLELSPTAPYASAAVPSLSYHPNPAYEGYYPPAQTYPSMNLHTHAQLGAASEPGQFADAGPPGYAYDPALYSAGQAMDYGQFQPPAQPRAPPPPMREAPAQASASSTNRWSTTSEEMTAYYHTYGPGGIPHGGHVGEWRTRSEWSSPMPGYEGWRA